MKNMKLAILLVVATAFSSQSFAMCGKVTMVTLKGITLVTEDGTSNSLHFENFDFRNKKISQADIAKYRIESAGKNAQASQMATSALLNPDDIIFCVNLHDKSSNLEGMDSVSIRVK